MREDWRVPTRKTAGISATLIFSWLVACTSPDLVSRDVAVRAALGVEGVKTRPGDLEVTLDRDPAQWTKTSATWFVSSRSARMDVTVDAETGRVLLVGEESEGQL